MLIKSTLRSVFGTVVAIGASILAGVLTAQLYNQCLV